MSVLALNCGSSSVKYELYDWTHKKMLAKGLIDRVGLKKSNVIHHCGKEEIKEKVSCPDHKEALKIIADYLINKAKVMKSIDEVRGVGHRVVHGGSKFSKSVLIDDEVLRVIKANIELAPLHNPPNILGIESAKEIFPGIPQVAIFDTAFHQTIPEHAYLYGLGYELCEKFGIRKYGFHGTSHLYVSERARHMLGKEKSKIITMHIGNGASMTAVKNGVSIDTSMGMTPLEGLVMGTRCGNVDPALIPFIIHHTGDNFEKVLDRMNKQSGMLGLSGVSSDQRDIEKRAFGGDHRCQVALEVQAYSIKKYIGSYMAAMGGLDAIVFTAGVGENAPTFRERVCKGLEGIGIIIDPQKNDVQGEEAEISTDDSPVKIYVIPTDEEYVLVKDVIDIIEGKHS